MNYVFAAIKWDGIIQLLVAILMFAFVIFLCYYTTKFVARYQKNVMSKGNIEILEAKRISNNKLIEIVRIGEEYFAIGVSKDNITMLTKVNKDTLLIETPEESKNDSFSQILDKVKKFTKDTINKDRK